MLSHKTATATFISACTDPINPPIAQAFHTLLSFSFCCCFLLVLKEEEAWKGSVCVEPCAGGSWNGKEPYPRSNQPESLGTVNMMTSTSHCRFPLCSTVQSCPPKQPWGFLEPLTKWHLFTWFCVQKYYWGFFLLWCFPKHRKTGDRHLAGSEMGTVNNGVMESMGSAWTTAWLAPVGEQGGVSATCGLCSTSQPRAL